MHGLTSEETVHELVDFVRKHYQLGHRTLHLVTGRGNNSPLGRSVLREEVQNWLTRDPLRRVVLAFVTAQPKHGGPGAVYVLLRKHKKSLGKVDWDMPLEGPDTF
nr:Smr/MutS family protein [Desulfobaculum xiamenense]